MTHGFLKSSSPSNSPLRLGSARKYATESVVPSTRTKSIESTLDDIFPICRKIGVTRVSDITHLHKLYIPNYSAIVPGTEDQIWVYSGKEITQDEAKSSALMEPIKGIHHYPALIPELLFTEAVYNYQRHMIRCCIPMN